MRSATTLALLVVSQKLVNVVEQYLKLTISMETTRITLERTFESCALIVML